MALPLLGGFADVKASTVMSLKLDTKLSAPFKGTEEDWPLFENSFECALASRNIPLSMLSWEEKFDQPLRESNHEVYDILNAKLYAALVGVMDREQVDVMYALMATGVRGKGRHAMRVLQQRYQPRTMERQLQLEMQLGERQFRLGSMSPKELVAKARFLRGQLGHMGVVITDASLLSRILLAMPDNR
jgi:hypothetical protein